MTRPIGILPDKAREVFRIPEGYEAWTGIAIGYEGDPATLPDNLKQRDLTPRQRKPLKEFVFTGKWGNPAPFLWRNARTTGHGRQLPGHLPPCGETVELFLGSDVEGSLVQDCEVCCNPWQVQVWTEGGHRRVSVGRADGSE